MNDITEQKENYREHARLHRDRLEVDSTEFETIIDVFFESVQLTSDDVIALYWPMPKEFDSRFLLDELVKREYKCALPCVEKGSRVLKFAQWSHETEMHKGIFGIKEPSNPDFITPTIVIAPLLAFDQKGYRLGQGGGYYDATIQDLRTKSEVKFVGMGYAEQAVLLKLPREDHDIPLDYMLTPQGVIDFEGR